MALQQTSTGYGNDMPYPHFYLCNYLPGSVGRDTFSNSLLNFKKGIHPDLEGWIDCTLEEAAGLPVREDTIIVRALHHYEPDTNPLKPASLDLLGAALAARFKCRYLPRLLHKLRQVGEIKMLTREQRVIALHQAYRFSPSPPGAQGHYLVLDDIVTTGSTMNAVIDAIRQEHLRHHPGSPPPTIAAFSLAKADYNALFNLFHSLRGRNYSLEQGSAWLLQEEQRQYAPSYSFRTLKKWIREDSFPRFSVP